MKTKKVASKKVASKRVVSKKVISRKVSSPKVAHGMNMWMVAGILIVVVGGAYLIKNMSSTSSNINQVEIGNTVTTGDYLIDTFRADKINENNWRKVIPASLENVAKIRQTAADNLIISINGTAANANAFAALQAKPLIKDDQNYSVGVVMYKPVLTSPNVSANSGIRFVSGADDKEAVVYGFRKAVNGKYYLYTRVIGSDGVAVEGLTSKEVKANKISLRINRRAIAGGKDKYSFLYNDGGDEATDWTLLSDAESTKLGGDGRVQLFASSPKINGNYVSIAARFDSFTMKRDNGQGTNMMFIDTFSTPGVLNPAWQDTASINPVVNENKVLILPVKAGFKQVGTVKQRIESRLFLNQTLEGDKPSTIAVTLRRPMVAKVGSTTPAGSVYAGVAFDVTNNAGNPTDSEGARIVWRNNKLVAILVGADGATTPLTVESPVIPATVDRVIVQIIRRSNRYIMRYKIGSEDEAWHGLVDKTSTSLGNAGKYYLFANNVGAAGKFPAGYGRFDSVVLTYDN